MNIQKIVGENIRSRRVQMQLSQEELAFRAGIDRAYLSQIENGKKNVTLLVVEQLSAVLECKPHELLIPLL